MTGPVRTAAQAQGADGQSVTLEGIYRKRMSLKGMPRPGREPEYVFLGYIEIELEGEGDLATIRLGTEPRSETEIADFTDKKVKVEGTLQLSPPTDPSVASTMPAPTLIDPGPVSAAD